MLRGVCPTEVNPTALFEDRTRQKEEFRNVFHRSILYQNSSRGLIKIAQFGSALEECRTKQCNLVRVDSKMSLRAKATFEA